jgi:hypothetical protein
LKTNCSGKYFDKRVKKYVRNLGYYIRRALVNYAGHLVLLWSEVKEPVMAGHVMMLKHHERWPAGKQRRRWKDNIKLSHRELGCGVQSTWNW